MDVFDGKVNVRESDKDRVIIYNLGIALYDIFFARRIYRMIEENIS